MSSNPEAEKIKAAIKVALEELRPANYIDTLNALTDLLITTLITHESLTGPQAYQRIVECFTEASGKMKSQRTVLRLPRLTKFQEYQRRQALVAQRTVKQQEEGGVMNELRELCMSLGRLLPARATNSVRSKQETTNIWRGKYTSRWQQFFEMTPQSQQAEAEMLEDLHRLVSGEMTEAEGIQLIVEIDTLERFRRLLNATGCPKGQPVIPWLIEHGLIVEENGGYAFTSKAIEAIEEH